MNTLQVTYKHISELRPYDRNARTHDERQIRQIADSIVQFGFTNPIIIGSDGEIIAGHGRYEAALLLKLDQVPTIELGHLSDEQKRALRLADNRISLNSGWDWSLVEAELRDLSALNVDVSSLGFNSTELDNLIRDVGASVAQSFAPSAPAPPLDPGVVHQPEPTAVWSEPPAERPKEPKASDDKYSKFELVMEHTNKVSLVETLDDIRENFGYDKIEEALMHMVRAYNDMEDE